MVQIMDSTAVCCLKNMICCAKLIFFSNTESHAKVLQSRGKKKQKKRPAITHKTVYTEYCSLTVFFTISFFFMVIQLIILL